MQFQASLEESSFSLGPHGNLGVCCPSDFSCTKTRKVALHMLAAVNH